MRKVLIFLVVLILSAAAYPPAISTTGPAVNAHPGPPALYEFYWDDSIVRNGWCWYTEGNYWAVVFDDEKTSGVADGMVTSFGAVTYPNWPGSTYEGCYMHVFADSGGYPGADLDRTYLGFTNPGSFGWVDTAVSLTTSTFYVAFEQIGSYPDCDSLATDEDSGSHNWTGYEGAWGNTITYGDFMIRCYWVDDPGGDYTAPGVAGLNPADGAEGVPVTAKIVFHAVDDVSGVDVATIEFNARDASRGPLQFKLAIGAGEPSPAGVISGVLHIDDIDPLDVVCTFTPDDDLPYSDDITCTVASGLADMLGNRTYHDIVWGFTTEDNPAVENCTWGEIKSLY
jgi:hypothetical protein